MQLFLWLLRWILKAAIFFTLFTFALNNEHEVTAHFFFGKVWKTPLIVLVLISFTAGLVIGALGMVPRWWRQRRKAKAWRSTASSFDSSMQPLAAHNAKPPAFDAPTIFAPPPTQASNSPRDGT